MSRLDDLWSLEWEHERNEPLTVSAIPLHFGRLRHIEDLYGFCYAYDDTTDQTMDRVHLAPDLLRKIDDGMTHVGFAREEDGDLIEVVRFDVAFAAILSGNCHQPLEDFGGSPLAIKQALLASGAVGWNGHSWEIDPWHPELRNHGLVTYERRGRTLRQQLEEIISSGWQEVIAKTLGRPILQVRQSQPGVYFATLADPRIAERLVGRKLAPEMRRDALGVHVQELVGGVSMQQLSFRSPNPHRIGQYLQLLIDVKTGCYVLLDLFALRVSECQQQHEVSAATRGTMLATFDVNGATWTPDANIAQAHINEGVLTVDLSILRHALPESILSEGTISSPLT